MLGLLVLGAIVAVVAVALTRGKSDEGSEETLAQNVRLEHEGPGGTEAESEEGEDEEALAESQHQNSPCDLGGEAPREGPRSPVGELVEDRACVPLPESLAAASPPYMLLRRQGRRPELP